MAHVVLDNADAAGLDSMLAGLLSAAVEQPEKARLLDGMNGTVTIAVPDAEVEVGLRFAGGTCRVYSAAISKPMVRLEMPADTLLSMSTIPLLAGMPSVFTPAGRDFTKQVLGRRVKIRGLRHLRLVTQLNRLLSLA